MAYYGFKPAEQAIQVGDNTIVSADIADGSIVNADLNASAAIALSKTQLVAGTGITLATNTLNVDAAQTQIISVGTIGTGVWQGTKVASAYLDDDTAHLSTTQTFSGAKTFSSGSIKVGTSFPIDLTSSWATVKFNHYYDGGEKAYTTGYAAQIYQHGTNGNLIFATATASANAAAAVSFSNALTLDSSQGATFAGQVQLDADNADLKLKSGGSGDAQIGFWDGSTNKAYFVWDRSDNRIELNTALDFEVQTNLIATGQLKIDTDQRYFTKWETTYGTPRDYWWRNDGGLLQLGEGSEGDGNVKYTFDTANKRLGIGETSPSSVLEVTGAIDDNWAGRFENTHSGGYGLMAKIAGSSVNEYALQIRSGSTHLLKVMGDGSATFAGEVNINGSYGSPSNKKFTKSVGGSGGTTELDFTVHTTSNNMHEPGFVRVTACATITNGSVRAFHDSIHFFRQYNGGFDDISEQAVTDSSSLTSVASSSTSNELRVRITFDSSGYYWSSAGTAIIATIEATNMDGLVKIT